LNKNKIVIIVLLVSASVAGHLIWNYIQYQDYQREILHLTERWAVIIDSHGQFMAVEPTDDEVWSQIVELYENKNEKWIGGIIEEFHNRWGFRFKPETIIVADQTIEGAQSWIVGISEDLDYWMNTWGSYTYVLAKIVEIHY
jgi:hypothetical protein